ncbi:MAG: GNAT family N-acetyltransferase, partial [Acidimicrobiales bacterium]
LPTLCEVARATFAGYRPGYLNLWTSLPARPWPGTGADTRLLAGRLGDLRSRPLTPELSARPAADLSFYNAYVAIHEAHCRAEPAHALHARVEARADLEELGAAGRLYEVLVDGRWAGVLAAEAGVRRGLRGAVVVELLLDPGVRGRGYGAQLSTLLARLVPEPDGQFLLGTIHADNYPAYRSALAARRLDVGGEVNVSLWRSAAVA